MNHQYHITLAKGRHVANYTATFSDPLAPGQIFIDGDSRYFHQRNGYPVSFDRANLEELPMEVVRQAHECGAEVRMHVSAA